MKGGPQKVRSFPHKYLASVFLALGFLVIWAGVLAGVLILQTFKLNGEVQESSSLYHFHEVASHSSFAIGEELVITVDWLLNYSKPHHAAVAVLEAQRKTDKLIAEMSEPDLEVLKEKVLQIRESVQHSKRPEEAIELYFQINEELLRKCFSIRQPRHEMPSPSIAFILFIQGAIKKFEEIALGNLYLKSSNKFSTNLKTKFLTSHVESNELIKTSLQFVPAAQAAWWESQYEHPIFSRIRDSIFNDNKLEKKFSSLNKKNVIKLHSTMVKKQLKSLKDTRKSMNDEFDHWIAQLSKHSKNSLSFHLSLAIAALIVIIFSICVIGCSLFEFGNSDSTNSYSHKPSKYRNSSLIVEMNDKNSLPNTFLCSSAITDPTITSIDGRKSLISS